MKAVFWLAVAVLLTSGGASAATVGPSFPCAPASIDALNRLTCSNDTLARSEIRMVQTYYALRQLVGPDGQKAIKSEFLSFVVNTRRLCGLPPVEPTRDQSQFPLPANAANCVVASYDAQRTAWANKLTGPAAEEAARAPEQNIAVQGRLQSLGFIPNDSTIDGVFGTGTRTGLLAWQRGGNRPETGFVGNQDASILLADAPPDSFAKWRVKPLAQADYHGSPVTITYKNMQVSLNTETSPSGGACAAGGILSFNAADRDANACPAVVERILVDGKEAMTEVVEVVAPDTTIDSLQIKAAIRRLDPATALPQVVITGFSGGAHCCTSTAIATLGADGTWKVVSAGQIDGDAGYNFLDLAHDGSSVLVDWAEEFNYHFSSYAGSNPPTRIQKFADGKLDDVTKDPRYQEFLLSQLRGMEASVAQGGAPEPNGYLAGWVAQKALVGQLSDGWRTMLTLYDRKSTNGLPACAVDERVWVTGKYGSSCPEGQEIMLSFPEALARHLLELGYLTAAQSTQLGFDPVRIEADRQAATARYEDQFLNGWFVITRTGNCMLTRTPVSPAAMVTADRARGVEDNVSILTSGDDGKPTVVEVGEPKGNGLVSAITFYRGGARCEALLQRRKKELEKLQ